MKFSIFSAVMAVGCSSVIILMIHLLRKRPLFLKRFGVVTIVCCFVLCFLSVHFTTGVESAGGRNHREWQVC